MNRLIRSIIPAILLAASFAGVAHAEWITREIRWQNSRQGSPFNSTAIFVNDTTWHAISAAVVDTTKEFSLNDATAMQRGLGGLGITAAGTTAGSDTTTIAFLCITSDTTTDTAPTVADVTMLVDGRVGGFGDNKLLGVGWVKADSVYLGGAVGSGWKTGNRSVSIPIKTVSPYGSVMRWDQFRARLTWTGSSGIMPASRVFIRYWRQFAPAQPRN